MTYIENLAKKISKLHLDSADHVNIDISEARPTIITARVGYKGFITKVYIEDEKGNFELMPRKLGKY